MNRSLLLGLTAVSVLSLASCKDRRGETQLLDTADAASGDVMLTANGTRAYPSAARIDAAITKLREARTYLMAQDRPNLNKSLRLAKAQLALRKVSPAASEPASEGMAIKCTLKGVAPARGSATATWSGESDFFTSNGSVEFNARADITYMFSFDAVPDQESSPATLSVTFNENNNIQDEVGNIGCEIPTEPGKVFCKEALTSSKVDADGFSTDDAVKVGTFSCVGI